MITLANAYLFCLVVGFAFTVGSAVIGGLFGGGDHGLDAGHDGPDFSHGYDAGGNHGGVGEGEVSAPGSAGDVHLPLLSPIVISFFLATFGGSGLLYQQLLGAERAWLHFPLALLSASAAGLVAAWLIWKLTTTFESNRMARAGDALNALAEVTVTVPAEGTGEVAYISGGSRQLASARSHDGKEHKQGQSVKVVKIHDGVASVADAGWPGLMSLGEGIDGLPTNEVSKGAPVSVRGQQLK